MGNEEEEEGRDAPRGNYSRRGRIFTRGVEARVDEMNFSKKRGRLVHKSRRRIYGDALRSSSVPQF